MFKRTTISTGVLLALGGALSAPALAQDTQRIEITGSAVKRIDAETALPVTIISKEEIVKSGATTAAELLDRITANNGQGYAQVLAIGDSARPGFAGASLRGLGSNTTLVLLNGRRLAVYAFDGGGTDLNSIALGAIERVEILRDGASALYGTDAIAGVMNFITRKDYRGIDLSVSGRKPFESGGGDDYHLSVTGGFGDPGKQGFNVLANLTYDRYNELKAIDRSFSKTAFLPNAPGGRFDRTSGNTFPASIFVPGVGTVNPGVPNCLPPVSFQTSPTGPCRFDYASVIDILTPQEKTGGLIRGTLSLGGNHEVYAEFNKTKTTTTFNISPTPASGATTFNADPLLYPAGGRWYPTAIDPADGLRKPGLIWYSVPGDPTSTYFQPLSGDLEIFWRTVEAGPRANQSVANQDRFLVGAKGTIFGKWDYDVGALKSTSKVTENYVGGLFSETKLLNATCTDTSVPCGPLNPTYTPGTMNPDINPFGPNDATGLAALRAAQILAPVRISKSTRESVDGKVSGDLLQLPGGPLAVALGAEHRKEKFNDQPLAVLGSGDIIGGGGNQLPVNASRKVDAVFGEVVAPVFKGFDALAQFRYDKYSDFGNTTNPKIGIRWYPTPQFTLRASAGKGFRAPTLPDLYQPVTQTNTGDNYNDPYYEATVGDCYDSAGNPSTNFNPTYCNAQLQVNQGGNPNLRPEKSRQTNIGLVFTPNRDWTFSLDVWRIKMDDQIGIPDADNRLATFIDQFRADTTVAYDPTTAKLTPAGKAALAGNTATGVGIPAPVSIPGGLALDYVSVLFDNTASSVLSGVDVSVSGVLARTAYGEFRGNLDLSYLDSYKQDGVELVGTYSSFGPVIRWKSQASLDWTFGNWTTTLGYRWQQGYLDQGETRKVGSYELFDIGVAYRGIKNLTLRAGIQNLADRDPPYSRQGDYFHVGYDPTYADPRGRTLTFGLQYEFK